MISPQSLQDLHRELKDRMQADRAVLDELRTEIRPLRQNTRRIQPRSTTAISLVATDGGNNRIEFDPFLVQVVRVVDSSDNQYCLEVVTPTTDVSALSQRQFAPDGTPLTALGKMMRYLRIRHLWELSPMIQRPPGAGGLVEPPKPSWVQVYRELVEWAILLDLIQMNFGTDTLIVRDGFLRSKIFSKGLFRQYHQRVEEAIQRQWQDSRRRIYVVGVAKHSQVLQRYRLAMAIEGVMQQHYPCFVNIPEEVEKKAYAWSEYVQDPDFVAGKMFFVKFGSRPRDPVWAIDLLLSQAVDAQTILGCLLADAENGFPVPFYPRCLQRAHENAALVDFDMDILQEGIFSGIRESLAENGPALDTFRLADADPSRQRYED